MLFRSLRHSELTGSEPLDIYNKTQKQFGNYIIPKKPIIHLVVSFNTLNEVRPHPPSDAERWTLVHRPPTSFIPEEPNSDKESKSEIV